MKIRIKTTLIEIEIEDEVKIGSDNYTKRSVPDFINGGMLVKLTDIIM
jgi:hypothetical protein